MHVTRSVWIAFLIAAVAAQATEPQQIKFSLSVRDGAAPPALITLAVPPGTRHVLQATEHLTLELSAGQIDKGFVDTPVRLLDDSSGTPVEVVGTSHWRAQATEEHTWAFTVCPGRVIWLQAIPAQPASCADLPAMANPDPVAGGICGDCKGPYEGMPATLAAVSRIAPVGEPGEPLVVSGRVFGADGKPRAGVIVYAYHTNAKGLYPAPDPPRSVYSNHHGRLRGWAQTDAKGRYTFRTIRPANYPNSTIAQHIHMHVVERGCATYFIDELLFTDDPMFQRMDPQEVSREGPGRGGKGITTPHRDASGTWHVERDIHLGQNIPGYPGCSGSPPAAATR
jgi:protocatechuate 3,4-dioxygenase beta subunit